MNPIKKHHLALTFAWFWPVLMVLILWLKLGEGSGLWLLRKSTWVLAIGVVQTFVIFLGPKEEPTDELMPYFAGLCFLGLVSIFLLPIGMGDLDYEAGLFLSAAFHFGATLLLGGVVYALSTETGQYNMPSDYHLSNFEDGTRADRAAGESDAFLAGLLGGFFLDKVLRRN